MLAILQIPHLYGRSQGPCPIQNAQGTKQNCFLHNQLPCLQELDCHLEVEHTNRLGRIPITNHL